MNTDTSKTALIDKGLTAHRSGNLALARQCYSQCLEKYPSQPEALHLLGLVFEQEGNRAAAYDYIGRAVAANPNESAFRINLAVLYEKDGDLQTAADQLKSAIESSPAAADIHLRYANILLNAGDFEKAQQEYAQCIELGLTTIDSFIGLAKASFASGRFGEAFQAASSVLNNKPLHEQALQIASESALRQKNWKALIVICKQWSAHKPDLELPLRYLQQAYFELRDYNNARSAYLKLIELKPQSAELLTSFARFSLTTGAYDDVREPLEKALSIDPMNGKSLFAYARLNMFEGDLEAARKGCIRAIAAEPKFAPAYALHATLNKGDVDDTVFNKIVELEQSGSLVLEHCAILNFAIGDILHRRHAYVDAFERYARANKLNVEIRAAQNLTYQPEKYEQLFEQERVFFESVVIRDGQPNDVIPIFIVGMPRSGTTLVESVLAAHPEVHGAGEINALPNLHHSIEAWRRQSKETSINAADDQLVQRWRRQYLDSLPQNTNARYVVDKQLSNMMSIGLMRALFPQSPVIHVRRNPIETGFSIFRNHFDQSWLFASGLDDIAHFYGEYAKITDYWENRLAEDFPLFQYETFVANFGNEARRLIEHCGLGWREECLAFHNSRRRVTTFSSTQVREPVYIKNSTAQEQYGDNLKPLIDGLRKAGVDIRTGALLP